MLTQLIFQTFIDAMLANLTSWLNAIVAALFAGVGA